MSSRVTISIPSQMGDFFLLLLLIKTSCVLTYTTLRTLSTTIHSDSAIPDICKEVRYLDQQLVNLTKNLQVDGGEMLIEKIRNYVSAMKMLRDWAISDQNRTNIEAKTVIDDIGPSFMEVEFDEETLREKYNWTDDEYDVLYRLKQKTINVWNEFHESLP